MKWHTPTYPSEIKMTTKHIINGFSKLSRNEKLAWLQKQNKISHHTLETLDTHIHADSGLQDLYRELSENNVSNFYLPFGLSPNFLINGDLKTIPMVTEESSVVAAASHAAKFWAMFGGFKTEVVGVKKVGQVHFTWSGNKDELFHFFNQNRKSLLQSVHSITRRMEERGGGIESLELKPAVDSLPQHYQLFFTFTTADAMGANFINSVLEEISGRLIVLIAETSLKGELEIIMSILSNYTPECLVRCSLEGEFGIFKDFDPLLTGRQFAQKFKKAVDIAIHDPFRAVTHNKGIFNGMDAVIMATGNDFRAVEACGHAYASKNGHYRSLSEVELSDNTFHFSLQVPLAVGTVGGLTGIHPMAKASLEILGNPTSEELMQVIASAGLANNFSAVRSLITTGIQQGHMKMHMGNILRQLGATPEEREQANSHFRDQTVSHSNVVTFIEGLRGQKQSL